MSEEMDDTTQAQLLLTPAVAPSVLIVDDDQLVLARLQELVMAEGFEVRIAGSGAEALAVLDSCPISIIITDLNMPGMSGLELCAQIRKRTSSTHTYLILLTVKDDEKDVLAGLDIGADDYLSKRTSASVFKARLRIARRVLAREYSLTNALEKKRKMAMADALTGVYNRRYFTGHLSRELKRTQRFGGDLSLLLLDVDNFKKINDGYGHGVGDTVLKNLTRIIGECLRRETDWCARLGGDEFAVVLEGTKLDQACECAEKVRHAVESAVIETAQGPLHITVSMGVAGLGGRLNRHAATAQSLIDHADSNLYSSKAHGRNRVTPPHPYGIHTHAGAREFHKQRSNAQPEASLSSVR